MDSAAPVSIVTGANSGIGLATTIGLAKEGHRVVMACRDLERSAPALEEAKQRCGSSEIELMPLDLSSQLSIREFAKSFLASYDRLDVLVNNAGVMPRHWTATVEGLEAQLGVNHIGPFLLTHLLLDVLKASAPSRVVTVSSIYHHNGKIDLENLNLKDDYTMLRAYGQSKLANILFANELARRLDGTGVTSNSLHPGVVNTRIMRNVPFFLKPVVKLAGLFILSAEKGAATSLYLATSPELEGVSGKFFSDCRKRNSSALSKDEDLARRLWDVSEKLTGIIS
jgi:NAD(P)-dependent dehydrogenase (short-subunit alcohol dehydrogenase family)